MPPKRMTANPVKPTRYRPGKPVAPEVASDEDELEEELEQQPASAPPPPASSFPSESRRIASDLRKVDLNERQRQATAAEEARRKAQDAERAIEEEGFVTEASEEQGTSEEGESGSEEEEDSSEEEQPQRVLLRPTFIKKDKRNHTGLTTTVDAEEEQRRKEEERKRAADELVQEQIRKDAEARAAGKKNWDDDEVLDVDMVDDTDGLDPEAELAAWKLRELKRVKRDREAIEQAEKEREEVERRRNLTAEEREAEDKAFVAKQQEEREEKGKMAFMQKYFHKGAYFQDDARDKGLDRRDIMGSRYQDDVANRELLPQYMQIRDMTKLGKKGRTKYRDLKSEDTGRWGVLDDRRARPDDRDMGGLRDERFRPDREGRNNPAGATGANASQVGERKRVEGAPQAPKALQPSAAGEGADINSQGIRQTERSHRRPDADEKDDDGRYRSRDQGRSYHHHHHHHHHHPHPRRSRSRSRSRSQSRTRTRTPRGYKDSYRGDGERRKRSPPPSSSFSAYGHRDDDRDKRRRVHV